MAGSQDAWRISGEDRSKHDAQFFQLKPVNGFVTGTQARDFFMQSGLPTQVLGQIWTLADMNSDGKMDKKEFSIAMHLIKKKLQGYELPKALPASLKADPTPVIGSFAQPSMGGPMPQSMGMGFPMAGMQPGMGMQMGSMMQPQASLGTATMTTGSLSMGPRMANGAAGNFAPGSMGTMPLTGNVPITGTAGTVAPPPGGSVWALPHNSKLKHTQTFNVNDRNKRGYLMGVEARAILMQSGLPQGVLAQIWTLSDIDRDGKLTCDEFCIAMHLSELARAGHALPATLPQELLPTKARSGSVTSPPPNIAAPAQQKDAFGDLLSGAGMSQPMPVVPAASQPVEEAMIDEQVTFEDKRKENFDKGQAELERRRAILREQQQKEEQARLEKERQEAEKRERQRQEAENKRQAELQRQLEKQREKEREVEEQRRKMIEQREAARRELERQRQMEWEKQRKEQLMAEKQREYEALSMLKSQMANLKNELESLDAKKAEISLKITQVQMGVTDFTTSIDAMRVSRDRTLADIDVYERQVTELNKKMTNLGSDRNKLNDQVQSAQVTPLSDTHRTVQHSVESKRTSIQKLKKEVEQLESDTEARLGEIDCNNAELKNLKDQLTQLERDLPKLQKQQEEKVALQKKATQEIQQKQRAGQERQDKLKQEIGQQQKNAQGAGTADAEPNWFDFNSTDAIGSVAGGGTSSAVSWDAFAGTANSANYSNAPAAWGSSGTTTAGGGPNKLRYRALYDFPASRDDELSLIAGVEVLVLSDFTPVPGMEDWYKGERDGKVGWFPKAYVERLDEPSTDLFGSAFEPVVQTSSAQKTETSQDLFSSQFSQPSAISNAPATSAADETSSSSHIPPEGLLAKATYPWKARQETDLTFDKDDVILVKEQQDMKWFGELNGKSGWFPKAYVKLIGVAPKPGPGIAERPAADPVKAADSLSASPAPPDQGEYYVAMYYYASDEPADLTFNEGDIIYVTAASGDWWTGTIAEQGKTGIFPANYVKKLEIQSNKASVTTVTTSAKANSSFDSLLGDLGGSGMSLTASKPAHVNVMNDLMGSPLGGVDVASSSAVSNVDVLGMSLGGADILSVSEQNQASSESSGASLSTETKPTQSLPRAISSDGSGVSQTEDQSDKNNGNGAVADSSKSKEDPFAAFGLMGSASSSAPGGDLFSGLSGLSWGQPANNTDASKSTPASHTDGIGSMQTVSDSNKESNILGSKEAKSDEGNDDPFSKADPFGNANSSPFGNEDPFANEKGLMNEDPLGSQDPSMPVVSKVETSAAGGGAADSLDWGFGDLGAVSGTQSNATSSSTSLMDSFGDFGTTAVSSSSSSAQGANLFGGFGDQTGSSNSTSQGFDVFGDLGGLTSSSNSTGQGMDVFGFGGPTQDIKSPSILEIQDLAAVEKDAAENDATDLVKTSSIYKRSGVQVTAGQSSSEVQVDMDMPRPRSMSQNAPPPPPASKPPPRPKKPPEQKSVKKPEIARVIAPYTATGTGQLSLETGNLINVRQKSPRGWWEGELQVRGQKKKIGWFPANYVKLLGQGSSARSTPEPSAQSTLTVGAQGSRSATPQSVASQDGVASMNQPETVVALYAYAAQNDDELTFQKDAVITVLSRDNPDWWSGQVDGQTGVFPSNYVTPSPQSQSWMNDTQGALTKAERKRQQAIQELINTEESYNTDMQVALEVFKKPMMNGNIIPTERVNQIFVNWEELIVCNKKLLQALRVRKKMCGKNGVIVSIGDILCESLPHMNPYMRFCSCQLSAAATLQRVSESSSAFQEFHRACMQNPKVKGVHVSGYLLKPMQRITRYPLLIEKILENTPADHADRGNLEEALVLAQELCSQANQCVKEKQNSDSLEWIQAHVHCDGLAENIVFNSLTNCLGPRRLLFHGILYKAKSNKELVGFLFNDFLMLAQTSRPFGTSFSTVRLFDTSTQFKMYRVPIFLNEVTVKKSTDEAEPSHFSVTSDRILSLKAVSAVERDTWVREIEAASKQYKDKARRKLERAHSVMRAKPVGRALVVVEEGVGLRPSRDVVRRPNVGRILVVIQEACHLKASDATGKSDPYCEVSMGSQEHRTKVIPGTLNPRWNASMQFHIRDVERDTLCFTIYDRDLYSPNDFLGRTEVRIKDVLDESGERRGPITKRLILHEVETGEVVVKLDLQLFES